MAKTRKTEKLITEQISREEAEDLFAAYAKTDAQEQKILAQMDLKITRIREQYQDELGKLEEDKQEKFKRLQHFAQMNGDLFIKRKSMEFAHGILGFRTGTPALKTRKGYTWAVVLDLLKKASRLDLVRTKEEVNKEAIIATRDDEAIQKLMLDIGVEVKQDESFFIEPKKEAAIA